MLNPLNHWIPLHNFVNLVQICLKFSTKQMRILQCNVKQQKCKVIKYLLIRPLFSMKIRENFCKPPRNLFLLKNSRNKSRKLSRIKTLENAFAYCSIYDKEKVKINIWVKLILMMLRDQLWSKRSTIVKVMPQEFW